MKESRLQKLNYRYGENQATLRNPIAHLGGGLVEAAFLTVTGVVGTEKFGVNPLLSALGSVALGLWFCLPHFYQGVRNLRDVFYDKEHFAERRALAESQSVTRTPAVDNTIDFHNDLRRVFGTDKLTDIFRDK